MSQYENLVSFQTYAKMKNVTSEAVRKWKNSGKIKAVNIDNRWYVKLTTEEVKEWRLKRGQKEV